MKERVGYGLSQWISVGTCWMVLCSISVAECGKMGHVESLSLKESVIRNHNGVLVMTLSPRRTVLSLSNGKSGVQHGHNPKHPKATVMFSKVFPPPSDTNDKEEEPFDNQTEAVPNPTASLTQEPFTTDSEQGQAKISEFDDKQFASASNELAHYNENESQASQSPLRNTSSEGEDNLSTYNQGKPEIGQVWSNEDLADAPVSDEDDFHAMIAGFLKREIWTIPLFVFASLNLVLITFFEIYVLCRTRGQSRRHLFLGQMLLFGLFLCSSLALLFAIYPSVAGCFIGRLGVGISYSLVFAVLMVKCMFLLSLDEGVYLPTSYQACLLFFAVLVQVVLDTQYSVLFPPVIQEAEGDAEGSLLLQCGTSYSQLLYSLSYIAFLIILVGMLSAKATCKGITENFRESIYILMSIIVSIPIAISWTVAGLILEGRHQDACVAFGLVAQSLTVFLIMFMPKGRQLAAMGKEGYAEDQDDQCSGYSPSFFHFKPTNKSCKTTIFGDGNLYTTLEPTLSTINPNVFFHRPDYHSGMIY